MSAPEKPRFPTMPVEEAHLRQSVLTALCGRRVDGLLLRGRIARSVNKPVSAAARTEGGNEDAWFGCTHDVAFRVIRLNAHPVRMDAADGPAMAALLDAADPLLAEIEAALGLTLEPAVMAHAPATASLVTRIDLVDDKTVVAQIDLALSHATPILATPAPFAPALLGHVPVPIRILMDGPRLSPADAASLAPGDLLLLGGGLLNASLDLPGATAIHGRVAPDDRQFRPAPHP
jgi:hypothetical protein